MFLEQEAEVGLENCTSFLNSLGQRDTVQIVAQRNETSLESHQEIHVRNAIVLPTALTLPCVKLTKAKCASTDQEAPEAKVPIELGSVGLDQRGRGPTLNTKDTHHLLRARAPMSMPTP